MCIFRKSDRAYYRFFNCEENEIWWCYDLEHAHKFKTREKAEYIIRTFNLDDVEIIDTNNLK